MGTILSCFFGRTTDSFPRLSIKFLFLTFGFDFDEIVASLSNAVSFPVRFPSGLGLGQITAGPILLFSGLSLFAADGGGRPTAGCDLDSDGPELCRRIESRRAVCNVPGKLIVLPPLSFRFRRLAKTRPAFSKNKHDRQSVPEGSEIWLHVVVGAGSLTGNESEQEITQRVDAFVKSLPLSAAAVRGLMVEIKEPLTAPDLFAFGLVRLALAARATTPACGWHLFFRRGSSAGTAIL